MRPLIQRVSKAAVHVELTNDGPVTLLIEKEPME